MRQNDNEQRKKESEPNCDKSEPAGPERSGEKRKIQQKH